MSPLGWGPGSSYPFSIFHDSKHKIILRTAQTYYYGTDEVITDQYSGGNHFVIIAVVLLLNVLLINNTCMHIIVMYAQNYEPFFRIPISQAFVRIFLYVFCHR